MQHTVREILALYPAECTPSTIESLGSAGGFSGAQFWRLSTAAGTLCLRRWPREHPSEDRLVWIHAVIRHVHSEGCPLVSVPLLTQSGGSFVYRDHHLWELSPWLPGAPLKPDLATDRQIEAALAALAEFHQAAASYPGYRPQSASSAGIAKRLERLRNWTEPGALKRLAEAVRPQQWPEGAPLVRRLMELFPQASPAIARMLEAASLPVVSCQSCLRDVWSDHILFESGDVSGLIDYGAMRCENVAADVARLLGSFACDDKERWQSGIAAYQRARRLSPDERFLVTAFDTSSVLLSGMRWLEWIYLQGRRFEDMPAVRQRLEQNIARLEHLIRSVA